MCSVLKYAGQSWWINLERDKDMLEGLHRQATKLVSGLKDHTYYESLKVLNLPTFAYQCTQGDLFMAFTILNNNESAAKDWFTIPTSTVTLNYGAKFCKKKCIRYTAPFRVVNLWNRLPRDTIQATSVLQFKQRLDTFLPLIIPPFTY